MQPNDYIQQQLRLLKSNSEPSPTTDSTAESIFTILMRKNRGFRKWSVDENSQAHIRTAIDTHIKNASPIHFTFPFGGYKLFSLPTAPLADWAEIFMFIHIAKYLLPITEIYSAGVKVSFWSDDKAVLRMNNVPVADTDAYMKSFSEIVAFMNSLTPQNMQFELIRVQDLYTDEEYEAEFAEKFAQAREKYLQFDDKLKAKFHKMSSLNINWNGEEDLTSLSEKEKEDKLVQSAIYHNIEISLKKRVDFVKGADKILLFSSKIQNGIGIGTTKSSMTKFWTGVGALQKDGEGFRQIILPPSKLDLLERAKQFDIRLSLSNENLEQIFVI